MVHEQDGIIDHYPAQQDDAYPGRHIKGEVGDDKGHEYPYQGQRHSQDDE